MNPCESSVIIDPPEFNRLDTRKKNTRESG